MSSMNMIKTTMMMALVLMGVRATTVTQSQETDRKFECHSMNHIAWDNGMYWNPKMCYFICSGPCGKDNNCRQRCKKCCHWRCMGPSC
ncbi:hypothetical protein AtNW77_Chr1g0056761 [Arabidopsis thaliana]|uniref:Uncharacterized protein n=1 Tax=Arabidopsis thaliana x Arabidopsis arenosa TaxID=1240361 RepID=A0A8T2GRP2_9BRAS|nr:hypothetical protein ISN45_At01g048520 [Arabidopsis thaliana x Arabidopsis arenosa]